jgi:molybdopterin adenylyltransferase
MKLRVSILTVSDRSYAGAREDLSGPLLAKMIEEQGWMIAQTGIVPDEMAEISKILVEWSALGNVDVILTTGGTGFAPRDITPEATLSVIERRAPGLVEAIRAKSLAITPHAMLSRAEAGIRGKVIIINLPGSPKAVKENFDVISPVLSHAVALLREEPDSEAGHKR